jgi:hypothetical protein
MIYDLKNLIKKNEILYFYLKENKNQILSPAELTG